jgi:hypothetical protein
MEERRKPLRLARHTHLPMFSPKVRITKRHTTRPPLGVLLAMGQTWRHHTINVRKAVARLTSLTEILAIPRIIQALLTTTLLPLAGCIRFKKLADPLMSILQATAKEHSFLEAGPESLD